MSKLNICNTGTTVRSVLSTEVVPLYKERIDQIKSNPNQRIVSQIASSALVAVSHDWYPHIVSKT